MKSLFQAVWDGDVELVKFFIARGDDLDEPDDGDSPIYAGVENVSLECLELILKHGASVETEMRGWSPLRWAVEQELCGATEGLWPTENGDWRRPVMSVTSMLLAYGADPFRKDSAGGDPYSHAIEREHRSFVELVNRLRAEQVGASERDNAPNSNRASGARPDGL